jgi:simple sugar transport system permease protein/ribose transport system permease protein
MISRLLTQNLSVLDVRDDSTYARRRKLSLALVACGIIALALVGGITTPGFLTIDNLLVIVRAASITGIVAIGMSYITISGNLFALSAAELAVLAACIFAFLMRAEFGVVSSVAVTLVAAIALGTGRPLGIPTQSWAIVILAVAGAVILKKTRFGRQIVLMGANRHTAQATGLNRTRVVVIAMSIFGLCCAIVGISGAAQFSRATATMFPDLNVDVVAAILVGGIALQGGRGTPLQAAFGAVFIALLQNYMLLHAFTTGQRMMVIGALVVASTLGYHYLQRKR